MAEISFSIVGCGRIGLRHAEHIANLGKLVAACDINPDALERFSKRFPGVKLYPSIEELLRNDKDSDVVNICTPNGYHAAHTIMALRNGKHVVCEKPMALTLRDAEQMKLEARKAGRRLFIVKQNRFNPPVQKVKSLIDRGILGQIFSAQINCFWNRNNRYYQESDWKGTNSLDGGILFTQFSHFIDLMYWFLGDVARVAAYSKNFNHKGIIDFEDTVVAILEFESGALATINCTINSHNKNMEGSVTLFAENGTVKIGGQYLNVLEYQNIKDYIIEDIRSEGKANDYGYYQGSMSNHDKTLANVIDVLQNNGKIATNADEGMKTVEIIEKIHSYIQTAQKGMDHHEMRQQMASH